MNDHYFSNIPLSYSNKKTINFKYKDCNISFFTDNGVFSKDKVDVGTQALLNSIPIPFGTVLDMACGWGVVSICLKKVYQDIDAFGIDINSRAVNLAKENASLNGTEVNYICADVIDFLFDYTFDNIYLNPPIRAGKNICLSIIKKAYDILNKNANLYLVIQTKQGAKSYIKYLSELFSTVNTINIVGGYRIIKCVK